MPALVNFKESLKLSQELMNLEKDQFHNPPRQKENIAVMGLRGGAAVLMVASFEFFVRQLFSEYMSNLNTTPPTIDFKKLPDKLRVKNVYQSLERAMVGPLFEEKPDKKDRIDNIMIACGMLIANQINPDAFSETGSNPNSSTVKEKFKDIGITDIFKEIKHSFEKKFGQPVADIFIASKLDEIVRNRHVVAHTADALNLTRKQLNESIKFLLILADLFDKKIREHVKLLLVSAKK